LNNPVFKISTAAPCTENFITCIDGEPFPEVIYIKEKNEKKGL